MAKRKCTHDFTRLRFKDGSERQGIDLDSIVKASPGLGQDVMSARCDDCGAQLGLGESDESPVAVEIRAAELAALSPDNETDDGESDLDGEMYVGEFNGWFRHRDKCVSDPVRPDQEAGWLARELATHDDRETREADAWAWDVSRPVAGQFKALYATDDRGVFLDQSMGSCIARDPVLVALADEHIGSDEVHLVQMAANRAAGIGDSLGNVYTDDHAEPASGNCRRCTECAGQRHHWIENIDYDEDADPASIPWFSCKHCSARCNERDLDDGTVEPDGNPIPLPASPALQAAAARYLASDEGKATLAERRAAHGFAEPSADERSATLASNLDDLMVQVQQLVPSHVPTDAERADFAYGNTKLSNDAVTREMADAAVSGGDPTNDNDNPPTPFDFDTSDEVTP